jgi:GT2 family glycosyltransferase
MDEYPKITVVIPIRNEAKFIAQTLNYILTQDYPADRMEIIVADGYSTDGSSEIVQKIAESDPRVRWFPNPVQLSSAGRNIGAKAATGDIIMYVDGHTYIDNDQLLKNTAMLMKLREVSVLSRPQYLETPDNSTFQKAVALARRSVIGHGLDSTIYTDEDMYVNPASSGATYKREVFDRVGYFDEQFDASEDYEFNYRVAKAGYQAFTSLSLAVYYYPRATPGALFQQMARYGAGRFRLFRKYPETLGLGTLAPVLFTLGIILLPLLSWLVSDWFGAFFFVMYGVYVASILISALILAEKNGAANLFLIPPIYVCIHAGLGYGFIVEAVRTLFGLAPKIERANAPEKSHDT